MIYIQTIRQILAEQRAFDLQKVITDAIKNRRKISFYYNGPKSPRKDSVKPGRRILVEPTALGLTQKGNLALKAYVKPPSVTKTGFEKHNWRTFLVNRLHRVELTDDTFDQPQPGFKAGDDNSFSKTYISVDFGRKPRINKYDQPVYTRLGRRPIDKTKPPELEPTQPELGKPEPAVEPTEPELTPQIEPVNPRIEPEFEPGTDELPEPKIKEKPPVNPDTEEHPEDEDNTDKFLQEEIKKIKTLMLKLKKL